MVRGGCGIEEAVTAQCAADLKGFHGTWDTCMRTASQTRLPFSASIVVRPVLCFQSVQNDTNTAANLKGPHAT